MVVSDPSVAGKSLLGFGPYGVSGKPQYSVSYAEKEKTIIDSVSYKTNAFVDETFREIRFVRYLK